MLVRCIAILISSWMPALAAILPFGSALAANALISGALGTIFALGSLSDNRLRIATGVIGVWIALSPFVFSSTLLEKALVVSWGAITCLGVIEPHRPSARSAGRPGLRSANFSGSDG
jgi:hypothetical protein